MADTKTTAEAAASALGGTELVRGVQSAANVKITIDQIKTWANASPTLVTPVLGVATGTSIALEGAALDGFALSVGTSGIKSGGDLIAGANLGVAATGYMFFAATNYIKSVSSGVLTLSGTGITGFTRLNFGGTTNADPSFKINGAGIEVQVADGSAFTSIQGKLKTDTAATTGLTAGVLSALTNASIQIYDGAGQAYRVPCII